MSGGGPEVADPVSADIAIVHLVRHANGPQPLEEFLSSYERHDGGCEHDLVLLCKGFPDTEALAPVRRRACALHAHELTVSDTGLDVTAYLAAAERLPHRRLCFVNSYATILAAHWLARLSDALDLPGTGLAGATGSWGSHRSFALSLLRLPNGYRGSLGDRRAMAPAFRSVGTAPQINRLRRLAKAATDLPREIVGYSGFPAPHVRTNAFVIDRALLLSLGRASVRTKSAAYRFEGGRRGLTGQVLARGLAARVVGRDAIARRHESWPDGELFWQGTQRELLVADNQTRAYEHGGAAVREALARYAWGPRARPAGGDGLR